MKKLFSMGIATLLASLSFAAHAQCTTNPVLQPDSQFPSLKGRLVYHTYSNYGDGSAKIFLLDFKSNVLSQLSQPAWNIQDPMNPHFSPDGKRIVFMGIQGGRWHAFIWTVGTSTLPVNLTAGIGGNRNEDPKFSFDGNRIVFKQDGNIRIADLVFDSSGNLSVPRVTNVTTDGATYESSMPFFTPGGKYVLYTRGTNAAFDIYRTNLITMQREMVGSAANLADYYPIVRDYSTYFFTRWKDSSSMNDQIYMRMPNLQSDQPVQLKLNDCNANNSDAAPVDEDYLVMSSTRNDSYYGLFLGDIRTGQVWSLNKFGVNASRNHKLGASYTSAR